MCYICSSPHNRCPPILFIPLLRKLSWENAYHQSTSVPHIYISNPIQVLLVCTHIWKSYYRLLTSYFELILLICILILLLLFICILFSDSDCIVYLGTPIHILYILQYALVFFLFFFFFLMKEDYGTKNLKRRLE